MQLTKSIRYTSLLTEMKCCGYYSLEMMRKQKINLLGAEEMKLNSTPADDPNFVRVVNSILGGVVSEHAPEIVALIQIDNWFDHQWLNFSGKVLGALGVWKKELTIPPFNPNRVKSQTVYRLVEDKRYEQIQAPPLHVAQSSSDNLNRKLKYAADSGVFLWWTSNTVSNGKGSVMVCTQAGDECSSWFASLEREPDWRVNKTEDIPVGVVERLMDGIEQENGGDA